MASNNSQAMLDKFAEVSAKVGNQVHLRSLRDAFATITPLYILAGVAVLINNVIFPLFFKAGSPELANCQTWGATLAQGTLSISAFILAGLLGYALAKNKNFDNPLASLVVGVSAFVIMMPLQVTAQLVSDPKKHELVAGMLATANTGTNGLFGAIVVSLIACTIFIKISQVKQLKVNLGDNVPPAVGNSFNVMIPMLLTLAICGLASAILAAGAHTNLLALISTFVAMPLKSIMNAGPWAVIIIYTCANLLFCLGIHQSTISGVTIEPILTMLIVDNMATFAAGQAIPIYNLPLMIPFVLIPDLFIGLTYGLTCAGLISPCVAQVPWTTPPVISAFFATGLDWRAAVWQVVEIILGMAIYYPFMRISEKASAKQVEMLNK